MSLMHANPNECQECGMMCCDYHPYAACLMYKACGDVETVTQNLEQVQRHRTKDLEQQLAVLRKAARDYRNSQTISEWVQESEGVLEAAEKALLAALEVGDE